MHNIKTWHQRTLVIFTIIIVSFSISSCTQSEQRAEKENNIVGRIGTDIALYKFHFKHGATRMSGVITAAEELLEAIRNPKIELSEEQIELDIHTLTSLWLAATPTTEYLALVSSGEISLVTSERLRRKFKEMHCDQEKLLQFESLQIRYINQELRPFLNSRIDKTTLETSQNFNTKGPTRFPSPFESSPKELLKNREFANLLVDVLFFTKRIMLPYNRLNSTMARMEEIIAEDYPTVVIETYGPH
ncbi:MAG: hypothetical protein AB8F95_22145 [Bacteroidia bacterium]